MQFDPDDPDLALHKDHLRQLRRMAVNEMLTTEAELAAWSGVFVADGAPNAPALRSERDMRIAALRQNTSNLAGKIAHLNEQLAALSQPIA